MRRILSCLAFAALAAGVRPLPAQAAPAKPARPQVEVAFVVDTTGSMGGLIQAAKEKVWAIANTLATAKPTPRIKMGLVAYRDRGDEYVTKLTALTEDLDAVYADLMKFQAQGGGDGPESVNQALHEAVTKMEWSKDSKAYRVIFLVGDYPPHMDYQNDVKYPETCKTAAEKGIIINTIQCGNEATTRPAWQEIARRAEGRYFQVEQSGGAILSATPFDGKLAALSRDLDGTRLYYGSEREKAAGKAFEMRSLDIARTAPATATAGRATYAAGPAAAAAEAAPARPGGAKDLVTDAEHGRARVAEVKADELPAALKKMTPAEREKHVAALQVKRKRIQAQINTLSKQRQEYLVKELQKAGAKGKLSLDMTLFNCIKEQAGKKGILYKGGPAL